MKNIPTHREKILPLTLWEKIPGNTVFRDVDKLLPDYTVLIPEDGSQCRQRLESMRHDVGATG